MLCGGGLVGLFFGGGRVVLGIPHAGGDGPVKGEPLRDGGQERPTGLTSR
jgi:hypothetical protein